MQRLSLFFALALSFCFVTGSVFAQNEDRPQEAPPQPIVSLDEKLVISYSSLSGTKFGPAAPADFKRNYDDRNLPPGTIVIVTQGEAPGTPFFARMAFVLLNDAPKENIVAFGKGWHYYKMSATAEHHAFIAKENPVALPKFEESLRRKIRYLDGEENEAYLRTLGHPREQMLVATIDARAIDPALPAEELEALLAPYFAYLDAHRL